MTLEEKIDKLTKAGMRLNLSQENLKALTELSDPEVNSLAAIATNLGSNGGGLLLTDFPSIQPPTT